MSVITIGVLLVMLCGIIEGVAQLLFKKSALDPAAKRRWVAAGVALFILQALVFTGALQFVEISTAFPIARISYVVVAILSRLDLEEPGTGGRWVGVVLVVVGGPL